MSKPIRILLPLAVLALGVALAVVLVRTKPRPERRTPEVQPPLVRVVEARPRTITLEVESQGMVRPRTASALVAQVGGRIEWVAPSFAVGGFFAAGELLVRIDSRDYQLQVEQARAQIAQAEVRLTREEVERDIALEEWAELAGDGRAGDGRAGDGRAGGGRDWGDAPPLVRREPQIAEARAALSAARAALSAAELNLARTRLSAPYHGTVRSKSADLGQFVGPGTPLAQLFAVDYAEVPLPVELHELAFLDVERGLPAAGASGSGTGSAAGAPVTLWADIADRRHQWRGRIVRASGEVDPQTRMLELTARVDDPYAIGTAQRRSAASGAAAGGAEGSETAREPLSVGLFVHARIAGRPVEGITVLPRVALRDGGHVLVVDDENRLRERPVEVLRTDARHLYVEGGLSAGERVCISPLEATVDGMRVRVSLEEPPPRTETEARALGESEQPEGPEEGAR
jgi:multidrug efflux pump subunit AcrA (membrane-fusion protein)